MFSTKGSWIAHEESSIGMCLRTMHRMGPPQNQSIITRARMDNVHFDLTSKHHLGIHAPFGVKIV